MQNSGLDDGKPIQGNLNLPNVKSDFWYTGNWVRKDGKPLSTAVYTDNVEITPEKLAAKLFKGNFGLGAESGDSGNTLWTPTAGAMQQSGINFSLVDGSGALRKTDEDPKPWTMPGCVYKFGGHVFKGWRASVAGNSNSKTVDITVPDGYTEGTDFAADLTPVFEALAQCNVANGNTEANVVTFTPIWEVSDQTYYVFLCDYGTGTSYPALKAGGDLAVSYASASDARFKPISELPTDATKPTNVPDAAKYFLSYKWTGSASPLGLPTRYEGEDGPGFGFAYKPGYTFNGWEVRSGLGTWSAWLNTTVTASQGISNKGLASPTGATTVKLDGYAFGDVALWPVLIEKTYTVSYQFPGDAELAKATGFGTAGADKFEASDVLQTGGTKFATAKGKADIYGYKFLGWTNFSNVGQGMAPVNGRWEVDSSTSHIWATLNEDAWSDLWGGSSSGMASDAHTNNLYSDSTMTLYSVWKSADTAVINLAHDEPLSIAGTSSSAPALDGQQVKAADDSGSITTTPALYAWNGNGITYRASDETNGLEAGVDKAFDEAGAITFSDNNFYLKAPVRRGYTFMGWGMTEVGAGTDTAKAYADGGEGAEQYVREHPERDIYSVLYVSYTPAGAAGSADGKFDGDVAGGRGTFALTERGVQAVNDLIKKNANDDADHADWVAVWRAEEYGVSLRAAKAAVQQDDRLDERWKAANDASAGWYYHYAVYPYWHEVDVPAYTERTSTYTFEGWYSSQVSGEKVAGGTGYSAGAGYVAGGLTHVAEGDPGTDEDDVTYTGGKLTEVASAGATAAPFHITRELFESCGGKYGAWGAEAGTEGAGTACNVWMRYRTVQIGVTAPVYVDLCADGGEAAYAVGTDGRELLESRITFTTTGDTSHELYVSQVEVTADSEEGQYANTLLARNDSYADDHRFFWLSNARTVSYVDTAGDGFYVSNDLTRQSGGNALDRIYFGTGEEAGDNVLNAKSPDDPTFGKMADRLGRLVLPLPAKAADPGADEGCENGTYAVEVKDGEGNPSSVLYRNTSLYYGLDLRRCHIDAEQLLAAVKDENARRQAAADEAEAEPDLLAAGDEWTPVLAKVKFTFEGRAGTTPYAPAAASD